jgi:hypothetical protein
MKHKMYISIPTAWRYREAIAADAANASSIISKAGFEPVGPAGPAGISAGYPNEFNTYWGAILNHLPIIRECSGIFLCEGWQRSLSCLTEATFAHSHALGRGAFEPEFTVDGFSAIFNHVQDLEWLASGDEVFIWVGGRPRSDLGAGWRGLAGKDKKE